MSFFQFQVHPIWKTRPLMRQTIQTWDTETSAKVTVALGALATGSAVAVAGSTGAAAGTAATATGDVSSAKGRSVLRNMGAVLEAMTLAHPEMDMDRYVRKLRDASVEKLWVFEIQKSKFKKKAQYGTILQHWDLRVFSGKEMNNNNNDNDNGDPTGGLNERHSEPSSPLAACTLTRLPLGPVPTSNTCCKEEASLGLKVMTRNLNDLIKAGTDQKKQIVTNKTHSTDSTKWMLFHRFHVAFGFIGFITCKVRIRKNLGTLTKLFWGSLATCGLSRSSCCPQWLGIVQTFVQWHIMQCTSVRQVKLAQKKEWFTAPVQLF